MVLWSCFSSVYLRITFFVFCFVLLFVVLGLKLRAFTLSHSTSPIFVKGFFEVRSCELFAHAGFDPQSSRSQPPESLGLQAWATSAQHFVFFPSHQYFAIDISGFTTLSR
jgi:hypothetical protein